MVSFQRPPLVRVVPRYKGIYITRAVVFDTFLICDWAYRF